VIVTVNRFADDSPSELGFVEAYACAQGVCAVGSNAWMGGGEGCEELAEMVDEAVAEPSTFTTIYERSDPLPVKLTKLVQKVYGGEGVTFDKAVEKRVAWAESHGYGDLPVCVAKTQMSLSDDARLLGAPKGFDLHVHDLRISAGAGFIVAICGDILLMPGMGKTPAALHIDVDDNGVISGLN
jgi:formate--tetrahydrofolate ligase